MLSELGNNVDRSLLGILVCPQDKGPLEYRESEKLLVNLRLRVAYPIVNGIPVLLAKDAVPYVPECDRT